MTPDQRERLRSIKDFPELVEYLHDELDWPIGDASFEDLTYDYSAEELGIHDASAARIVEIKRLRPLTAEQPWGIFFVSFEPKRLPVVALRRILSSVAIKKRSSANAADRLAWKADDLLFVSNFGNGDQRQISFAHFAVDESKDDLPTLKVLGWDDRDTPLHLDSVAETLRQSLMWPDDPSDVESWRRSWRAAFSLTHREVITTSRGLALRLAELARSTRERILTVLSIETETGPVSKLMAAFREALIHDLSEGDFADMYAQTIAYGLLSARVVDPGKNTADHLSSSMPTTTPFLRELMETFLTTGGRKSSGLDFDELGVGEVVDLLDAANMEAVLRDFGDRNPQEDPVIHFYELFLKEYDPQKRLKRGVFYTPRPVVSYIVRSVHDQLCHEFGLADGLADASTWAEVASRNPKLVIPDGVAPNEHFVKILDPATGTGTFLVEVVDVIHSTLMGKWEAQGLDDCERKRLWNEYVPQHLLPRLFGYELLMAPYAIAHLKIGLKLHETGYRFAGAERVRVYLTNSLEPGQDYSGRFEFAIPALAHEAKAVNRTKTSARFTVVLGNPPYSLLSGNLGQSQRDMVEPYKFVGTERIRERGALQFEKNLQDDYVKFIRLAETLVCASSVGIVAYVTNHAFLDNTTFRGVRWHLLSSYDQMFIVNLQGNSKRGLHEGDQNVFDIQQGVAVSFLLRTPQAVRQLGQVDYADVWGSRQVKYDMLLGNSAQTTPLVRVAADPPGYLFLPAGDSFAEYDAGVPVDELFVQYSAGVVTARDALVLDFDRSSLHDRITAFAESDLPDEELLAEFGVSNKKGWSVAKARASLAEMDSVDAHIYPITYRPFDKRWVFYHGSLIWGQAWPTFRHILGRENVALMTTRKIETGDFAHASVIEGLGEWHSVSMKDVNYVLPLYAYNEGDDQLFDQERTSNLRPEAVAELGISLSSSPDAVQLFRYAYALLHSPTYRSRYTSQLVRDFPRVLRPSGDGVFTALAKLGKRLIAVHTMKPDQVVDRQPEFAGDKNQTVGRVAWSNDTVWLDQPPAKRGRAVSPRGAGFVGVSRDVWESRIGSYQVCEKWLKDRRGRVLSEEDVIHYRRIVVSLAETLRIMCEVDDVIEAHGGWPGAFLVGAEAPRLAHVAEDAIAYAPSRDSSKDDDS